MRTNGHAFLQHDLVPHAAPYTHVYMTNMHYLETFLGNTLSFCVLNLKTRLFMSGDAKLCVHVVARGS